MDFFLSADGKDLATVVITNLEAKVPISLYTDQGMLCKL